MVNKLLFLYPHKDIIDFEIQKGCGFYETHYNNERKRGFEQRLRECKTEKEKREIQREALEDLSNEFGEIFSLMMNSCIHERYRERGFEIYFSLLDECEKSDRIAFMNDDKIISVGMSAKTHRTEKSDGTYPYPNEDYMLNQLGEMEHLRIAGFHLWSCVQKVSRRAYERGIDVLVDEDLTELFAKRIFDNDFEVGKYKAYDPIGQELSDGALGAYIEIRIGKPWMTSIIRTQKV